MTKRAEKFETLIPVDIRFYNNIWQYEEIETRENLKDGMIKHIEIFKNEDAVFVKLCDIIANSLYSALTNSSMFNKYKEEYVNKVKPYLYSEDYKPMFNYLDKIYQL